MTDYAALTPEQYAAHIAEIRAELGFDDPRPEVVLELPPRERIGLVER